MSTTDDTNSEPLRVPLSDQLGAGEQTSKILPFNRNRKTMPCACGYADECDGEHATHHPLQDGGMCAVDKCRAQQRPEPSLDATCPYCAQPAPGWTSADVRRGRRYRSGVLEFHCRMAAD